MHIIKEILVELIGHMQLFLTKITMQTEVIHTSFLSRLMLAPPLPIIPPAFYTQQKATTSQLTSNYYAAFTRCNQSVQLVGATSRADGLV